MPELAWELMPLQLVICLALPDNCLDFLVVVLLAELKLKVLMIMYRKGATLELSFR